VKDVGAICILAGTRFLATEDGAPFSCARCFQFEERFLSFHAPTIAARVSTLADHAVAGNGNCDRVGRAGSGYGSRGCGLADRLGHVGVGTSCPEGDGLQMRPNAPLKCCRLNVQRQSGVHALAAHLAKQIFFPRAHGLVIAAADGERELVPQPLLEFAVGIGKLDSANSFVGGRD
jgi:hypothetical protein